MSTHCGPLLALDDLTISFPSADGARVCAVSNFSCSLQPGEAVGIIGESGCGKTTTALAIMGLLPAATRITGAIRFDGADLRDQNERVLRRIRGARISLVLQEPVMALHPLRRIGCQVADVLCAHERLSRGIRQNRVSELLSAVGLKGSRIERRYPHELSGGQRQRVIIAQALACEPRLLIMDEPFAALDYVSQHELITLIKSLRRQFGTALLFITHDPSLLGGLADRIVVMSHGQIVESGGVDDVLTTPRHPLTRTLVSLAATKSHSLQHPAPRASVMGSQTTILRAAHLVHTYTPRDRFGRQTPGVPALQGVSITLSDAGTLGIVGRSGSGKSTLARCLAGLDRPMSGRIWLHEQELTTLSGAALRDARRRVQLVFQEPAAAFNPRFTVAEAVTEPIAILRRLSPADRARTAGALLARVGLSGDCAARFTCELSGGQRQRLAIARALAADPDVLILDEAFAGLDLVTEEQLVTLLGTVRAGTALGLIFISHDLPLTARIADQVLVMSDGRIIEQLTAGHLASAAQDPRTRELIAAVPDVPADVAFAVA